MRRVAVLGPHPPRRCTAAAFTQDLRAAITQEMRQVDCFVVAVNQGATRHAYPPEVRCEIERDELDSYRAAARFLDADGIDVLCLQHDFGVFGGAGGRYIVTLLESVRAPIVTTVHTCLATPGDAERAAMVDLVRLSARLVSTSTYGGDLLRGLYGVGAASIDVIPHGVLSVPVDAGAKARLGLVGRRVILTSGLLTPAKGIEFAIGALPAVAARYPNVLYLVLGATHPHVLAVDGERYRDGLRLHAHRLGVSEYVRFDDRFVTQEELVWALSAADVVVTPYLNTERSSSGTLAQAVGAGRAVISTPYRHARELLAEGHGLLVPFQSSEGIARAVLELFGDPARHAAVCARAAERGRSMLWPKVARRYWKAFAQAVLPGVTPSPAKAPLAPAEGGELPALNLSHLRVLTDGVGVLKRALLAVPRYEEGYTLDDNAQALQLTTSLARQGFPDEALRLRLEGTYLGFVQRAFDGQTGRFRSFMAHRRDWLGSVGSEDSHGRALWSLGCLIRTTESPSRRVAADYLFHAALRPAASFASPRAWAFVVLGLEAALDRYPADARLAALSRAVSTRLLELFGRNSQPEWPWFEERVTHANAVIPHALVVAGRRQQDERAVTTGLRALAWLMEVQRSSDGGFSPIGSNGFFERGGTMAAFDQRPIEAAASVAACLRAQLLTQDDEWGERARRAFRWFLGQNVHGLPLFDASTGGCRDALREDRLDENQGAEATLSFLQALTDLRCAAQERGEQSHGPRLRQNPRGEAFDSVQSSTGVRWR